MTQNGFYVTLPSNASAQVYPKNQIWNYRTKLAKAIVLSEPHEVGLVEFQYPRVWYSFPKTDAVVKVYNGKNRVKSAFTMDIGVYESIQAIVKAFNARISTNTQLEGVSMHYSSVKNRVYFLGSTEDSTITFVGRLATILGFKDGEAFPLPTTDRSHITPYPADIHARCYTFYIYSDIVDYQLVGDSHVPLLRCINVAAEQRRIPTLTYDRPQYTSLSKNVIDDIEISIKNDQNGYIPFLYGKVIAKLHFRPIKQRF